jgi:hypothetical protein
MAEDKYVLHKEEAHHKSHHSSTHSHNLYPGIASSKNSNHRNNPASVPWQYKAHTDQHDKSYHKDEDSPYEASSKSDHKSVEADQEVVLDPLPSHTNKSNSKGSFDAKDYNQDNARREESNSPARHPALKLSAPKHLHSWTIF